jgi:hypothetical protein
MAMKTVNWDAERRFNGAIVELVAMNAHLQKQSPDQVAAMAALGTALHLMCLGLLDITIHMRVNAQS